MVDTTGIPKTAATASPGTRSAYQGGLARPGRYVVDTHLALNGSRARTSGLRCVAQCGAGTAAWTATALWAKILFAHGERFLLPDEQWYNVVLS